MHSVARAIRMWPAEFRRVRDFMMVSELPCHLARCEHSRGWDFVLILSTTSTFLPPFAPRSLRASRLLWTLCLPRAFHVARGAMPGFATSASDRSVLRRRMISRHRFLAFFQLHELRGGPFAFCARS